MIAGAFCSNLRQNAFRGPALARRNEWEFDEDGSIHQVGPGDDTADPGDQSRPHRLEKNFIGVGELAEPAALLSGRRPRQRVRHRGKESTAGR